MVATLAGAAIGGAASAGVGFGLNKLFNDSPAPPSQIPGVQTFDSGDFLKGISKKLPTIGEGIPFATAGRGFNRFLGDAAQNLQQGLPGLSLSSVSGGVQNSATIDGGQVTLNRGQVGLPGLNALNEAVTESDTGLTGLLQQLSPGFGRLTESRVTAVRNARDRGLSNLRDQLSRRRILGSSFGNDAIVRAEREFAQQEADVRATSFLEEVGATQQLITQQFQNRFNAAQTGIQTALTEAGIDANLTAQLSNNAIAGLQQTQQLLSALGIESARLNQATSLADASAQNQSLLTRAQLENALAQTLAGAEAGVTRTGIAADVARFNKEAEASANFGGFLQKEVASPFGAAVGDATTDFFNAGGFGSSTLF